MPCLSALNRVFSRPAWEVGPVLRFELRLLASARFDEVLAVSVMVDGPIVGMWLGEFMSLECEEGVSVSHHRKGLPFSASIIVIGNFLASHGTFSEFFQNTGEMCEQRQGASAPWPLVSYTKS
jgi:hypothetical protein